MARDYSFLKVERDGGVGRVTFNRPTWALAEEWELTAVIDEFKADDDVRVMYLTGTGDTFCGGAHHGDDPFVPADYFDRSLDVFGAWMNFEKPIVVGLNGPATGSGLSLMTLSDIVICPRGLSFADPHVRIGVVSATGSFVWPLSVGLWRARRYLLSGDAMDAEEAQRIGLVHELVDSVGDVETRGMELAHQIASLPPQGVQGTKRALTQWLRSNWAPVFEQGLALEFLRFPNLNYGQGEQ
jgi:enoyl-CoA hydratase